jgi:hypothetical protein
MIKDPVIATTCHLLRVPESTLKEACFVNTNLRYDLYMRTMKRHRIFKVFLATEIEIKTYDNSHSVTITTAITVTIMHFTPVQ